MRSKISRCSFPYGNQTITRNGQTQTMAPLGQHWGHTGRFLQRDPLGYSEQHGLYSYEDASPTMRREPSGLSPDPIVRKLTPEERKAIVKKMTPDSTNPGHYPATFTPEEAESLAGRSRDIRAGICPTRAGFGDNVGRATVSIGAGGLAAWAAAKGVALLGGAAAGAKAAAWTGPVGAVVGALVGAAVAAVAYEATG